MNRRSASFGCVVALVSAVVTMVGPQAAHAASTVGSFEIDGNLKHDATTAEPIDWETAPNVTPFTDPSGSGDDSFQGSSKELSPGGWNCITSSVPQKDDILSGAIGFRTYLCKQFVYGNYTRKGTNGDAHIDY